MQCPLCNATVDEADAKDHYPCDSGGDALRQYTIDRISNSGNAIAHKEGETNIGPLSPDSVGKTVNAQRINGTFAICTDTEFWTEEYVSYIREHNRSSAQSSTKQKNREDTDSEAGTVASSDESKYEGEISTNLGASYDELLDNIDDGSDDDGDDKVPWETSSSRGRYNSTAERSTRSSSSSDSNSTGSSKSKEQDSTKRSNRTASTSSSGPPSRSDLIEEVRAVNDELEHPIRRKDLERKARFNYSQYRDEFGPILDILQAAGIDRREQCINEIHSVVDEINRLPNRADIESESQVSGSFVLRQFDDLLTAHQAYLESEHLDSEGASDDLLLGEIERLGREQQETRPVMPSDVAEGSVFAPATFTDRFGSWSAALEEAGVDVKAELRSVLEQTQEGVTGSLEEYHIEAEAPVDVGVIEEVFGSIPQAVEAIRPEGTSTPSAETAEDEDQSEEQQGEQQPDAAEETELVSEEETRGGEESSKVDDNESAAETEIFWDRSVEQLSVPDGGAVPESVSGTQPQKRSKLDKKIDEWKSQLLDLTRRNNLISFNETKSKSLPFQQAVSTDVAATLTEENGLHIRKHPEHIQDTTTPPSSSTPASSRQPDETVGSLRRIERKQKRHLRERGVDTLYLAFGMLRWFSVEYSDTALRSPLFLLPIELTETATQESEKHNYSITAEAAELQFNPALRKKLAAEHDISMPADELLSLEEIDPAFETVYRNIGSMDRWSIHDELILGVFDFTKFSLYDDLEALRDTIKTHPIVTAITGDPERLQQKEGDIETPSAAELDEVVDPVETFQVLDADSSQQEAIEAAKRGKSFVLQGPPGTGKSQTISNIIAEKLAAGERILFVSEKQAALDVVKTRLSNVGLGRFCLEVHGQKAKNTDVLDQLESELNASPVKSPANRRKQLEKLQERRETINEYGDCLWYSPSNWEMTVYQALGIVSRHDDAPRVKTGIEDPLQFDQETVEKAIEELAALSRFDAQINSNRTDPWRHTTLTQWRINTSDLMRQSLKDQQSVLEEMADFAERLQEELNVTVQSVSELRTVIDVLQHLRNRPNIAWQKSLFSRAFLQNIDRFEELARLEQERSELMAELSESYQRSFFSADGAELNSKLAGYGMFKILRPSYRSLKRQVVGHTTEEYDPTYEQLVEDTRKLAEIQQIESRRDEYEGIIQSLGALYQAGDTDWGTLQEAASWAAEFVEYDDGVTAPIVEGLVSDSLPDIEPLYQRATDVADRYGEATSFFDESMATEEIRIDGESRSTALFTSLHEYLSQLETRVADLQAWVQFANQLETVEKTLCDDYVDAFLDADHDANELVPAFKSRYYTQWINAIYSEAGLDALSTDQLEQYIDEFQKLDQEQQELAKIEIQHRVTKRRPSLDLQHASSSEQMIVRRETEKQRRHRPLRELFDEAGSFITELTPCFMMSPISVAQYLKPDSIEFDTVIFDEASQIMPQDAISSLIRADQAIIAGDTKQLPPTSFFRADVETTEDVREDLDSILEEAAAVMSEKRLRWHYRSRTDELIQFSNYMYYDGSLRTFPENDPDIETGVSFEYVADGIYDRGGSSQNRTEAERVVDLIQEHIRNHSGKSLGVVAFSSAQETAVRDALDERRKEDGILDSFVAQDDVTDEFFIKRLEMVQGDERDRMIFTVGYGPDETGTVHTNFGPINKTGGERRLNVAVTRAREHVTVVSSMQPEDIDLTQSNSTGAEHFKKYLKYAKDGDRVLARDDTVTESLEFDSTFEEAVYETLQAEGFDVVSQVESSGYSIDLAIKHPDRPGEFILGIECDGAAYHSSKTARDRDRIRQSVLEDLGWTIHRIWSPDWASNKQRELEKIKTKIDELTQSDHQTSDSQSNQVETAESYEPEKVETAGNQTHHDEITEYEAPSLQLRGDKSFDEIGDSTINNTLLKLVNEYGPIHAEAAYREVIGQWQITRLGKNVRQSLHGHALGLHTKGKLVRNGEFLWPVRETLEFKIRVNTGENQRSIDQIPIEELAKAAGLILSEGGEMIRDDLALETARMFGYERRGQRIQNRVGNAIDLLIDTGAVQHDKKLKSREGVDIDSRILDQVYTG